MFKKGNKLFILVAVLFLFFGAINTTLAAEQACTCKDGTKVTVPSCSPDCTNICSSHQTTLTCIPVSNLPAASTNSSGSVTLNNPLCPASNPNCTSPQLLIGKIINAVLGVVGSIALIMFIFGGLTWMTSGGSSDKVKKGRDMIVWSIVGLAVIFASYGIVRFLILTIK